MGIMKSWTSFTTEAKRIVRMRIIAGTTGRKPGPDTDATRYSSYVAAVRDWSGGKDIGRRLVWTGRRTGTFIKSHNGRNPRNYGYRLAGVTRDALEGVVVDLSRSRPRPTVSVRSREGVDPDFKDLLIEPTSAPKVRHALA